MSVTAPAPSGPARGASGKVEGKTKVDPRLIDRGTPPDR